jgi:hypothetical protein
MGRACSTNGANRNAYRILVGKPEGKRPLGRSRHRWMNNIKTYIKDVACEDVREGQRLRVFENRVLRRTFGPRRDEVTGDWRKLHNEELHNLYSSPNIIRMIK